MKLWHRAPRAVYRVYDGDDYLAGPDTHDGEQGSVGQESQDLAGGFGHIDAGYSNHSAAAPDAHVREPLNVFTGPPRRGRPGRALALSLLCVVAASAAALVGLEISHRSAPARAPVRRTPARPLRSVVTGSNVPKSKISVASASASTVSVHRAPDRRPVAAPADGARAARSSRRASILALPTAIADVAKWPVAESQPTPGAQVDREFGFER
jgi:hypothetical protein